MLREMDADKRHEALATDYVAAVSKGKSALVISPTHAEGERVTREIRAKLKAAKKLAADEHEFIQLKNLQWTEAQRADARNYQAGHGRPVPSKRRRVPARGTGHGKSATMPAAYRSSGRMAGRHRSRWTWRPGSKFMNPAKSPWLPVTWFGSRRTVSPRTSSGSTTAI